MLQFAGQLEIALQPPIPLPPFHSGDGQPVPGGPFSYGVFYQASVDGILYWYKYEGNGESDPSGKTGWNANSGNPIGKGWNNFRFLLGAGDGVILGVEPNGDMRWYRYMGNGENNIEGRHGLVRELRQSDRAGMERLRPACRSTGSLRDTYGDLWRSA